MATIITAYKVMMGDVAGDAWHKDTDHETMDDAIVRMEQAATCYPVAAVFYWDAWHYGGEPKYIIDNTDKSKASIRGLEGLVNSVPSTYL